MHLFTESFLLASVLGIFLSSKYIIRSLPEESLSLLPENNIFPASPRFVAISSKITILSDKKISRERKERRKAFISCQYFIRLDVGDRGNFSCSHYYPKANNQFRLSQKVEKQSKSIFLLILKWVKYHSTWFPKPLLRFR